MKPFNRIYFSFCLGLVLSAFAAAADSSAAPQMAAAQDTGDVTYSMPPGWIMQPVQGGPNVKAHYAYYYGGMPYGEMYLFQDPLPGPINVDQFFNDGLARVKPTLQYYQARGTQRANFGGIDTIVHDFSHATAGVIFMARSYVIVINNSGYNFHFQTVSNYFQAFQSAISQVMASVKPSPKPAAPAVPGGPPAVATTAPGAGMTVEEMGLIMDLPPGWGLSGDAAGAKYRLANARGTHVGSLAIWKPDQLSGLAAMFGATADEVLNTSFKKHEEDTFRAYQNYKPVATVKRKIAGYDGLIHDYTCDMAANQPAFFRWVLVAMKTKEDTATTKYGVNVERCAFMAFDMTRLEEFKAGFDTVINSMRRRGAPAPTPAATPEPAAAETGKPRPSLPKLAPDKPPAGQTLPSLAGGEERAGFHRDPSGRYFIKLPEKAKYVNTLETATTYAMPEPKTTFQVVSYGQESAANNLIARFKTGKTLNGVESEWEVGKRRAMIGLYTARDESGDNMAWVLAHFKGAGLIIIVNMPAKDYPAAQGWIGQLIGSVDFAPER